MRRPATPPSLHWRFTVLTLLAVVVAFGVLALLPTTPPVTHDEVSGAIDHLIGADSGHSSPPATAPTR
ncbi:hypothetical protein FVQ98_09970 [Ottowia sp. GY511]|uniref:Secreted protein n=1 Tax=Ottowia flava TaxID=2675430 RepID=A0ABW4KP04_9BURK|nr:hypothetical protein [Ottowia sp. GY511]TXK28303.1 hypothetical protein FVQ98_09970 [Ottowia sp. GY511]